MAAATLRGVAPCARCAEVQRTCCQRAEVLLTEGDVARIAAHVGSGGFHERRRPVDPAYTEVDPGDRRWTALTVAADGTRRTLRRRPDGDCVFLGSRGCVLPLDVRPLVCRLYPFSYTEHGLTGTDPDWCPTALLAADGRSMVAVLGMSAADAEGWRSLLYQELEDGTP